MMEYKQSSYEGVAGIEYFQFETDFVEKNIRCIPMIVRFKMDTTGIKLKLSEWSCFSKAERIQLALMPVSNEAEIAGYNTYLAELVRKHTGDTATSLAVDPNPEWQKTDQVPLILAAKVREFDWVIPVSKWRTLTDLQRFALLKLCRPGHENKNFPRAMQEFNLDN